MQQGTILGGEESSMGGASAVVWCTPPPLQRPRAFRRRFLWSCIVTPLLIVLSRWVVV